MILTPSFTDILMALVGRLVGGGALMRGRLVNAGIVAGASGGPTNGLLQEDGSSFILAETGNYLVQE